jgi:hypothetical protein
MPDVADDLLSGLAKEKAEKFRTSIPRSLWLIRETGI